MPARLSILSWMNTPLTKWLCQMCFLVVFTSSCAAITPAVPGLAAVAPTTTILSIHEGRPTSLVLQLVAQGSGADTIELWRSSNGEDLILLQSTPLDAQTEQMMATTGVLLVDPQPPLGASVYMTVFRAKGEMTQSTQPLEVQWTETPEAPNLVLEPLSTHAVRLRWNQPVQNGCVVFRRDLITGERPSVLARMKTSCDGVFLDTSVHPSGVYSYRVATSDLSHGFPRFSEPSAETYITIPEGP